MDRASRTLESVPNLNWQGMPVSSNVQCLFFENDDILWFGTYDEGIYRYDIRSRRVISRFSKEDTHSGLLTNWIVFIVRISTGKILVGTGRGLFLYDDETH